MRFCENKGGRIEYGCPSKTLQGKQTDNKLQARERIRTAVLRLGVEKDFAEGWRGSHSVRYRDNNDRQQRVAREVPTRNSKQRGDEKPQSALAIKIREDAPSPASAKPKLQSAVTPVTHAPAPPPAVICAANAMAVKSPHTNQVNACGLTLPWRIPRT